MTHNFSEDSELIEALKSGDPKACTFLVNTYHHKLCVYAYSLIHDQDAAEDIVQNVFISTWRKRGNLKADFSIKGFLYKSVYNEFIDHYRKQKFVFPLEKKYIDELTTIVEEDDYHSLERTINIVKKEIQNLPPKCKEIFLLSKENGLSNVEISEYKNISIKSVEAHITKAFTILRKAVGDKVDGVLFLLFGIKRKLNS